MHPITELAAKLTEIGAAVQRQAEAAVEDAELLRLLVEAAGEIRSASLSLHLADQRRGELNRGGMLFEGAEARLPIHRAHLVQVYQRVGVTADDLPYTPYFEQLLEQYQPAFTPGPWPDHAETWRHLLTMRKAGELPRLGPVRSRPPEVDPELLEYLRRLVGEDMGRRDRLPYTPRFNEIAERFNARFAAGPRVRRTLSPHHVWRLIANLAK